jgi:hypothetical protein
MTYSPGLLRSWIDETALAEHAAQVSVQDGDRDPGRFGPR